MRKHTNEKCEVFQIIARHLWKLWKNLSHSIIDYKKVQVHWTQTWKSWFSWGTVSLWSSLMWQGQLLWVFQRYNLYKFMTAYNIYRFANWNRNNHSIESLWARRHPLVCSLHLGCLPCLPTDALEFLLKAVVWVVELGGKPLSVELVPWSGIANPVLLNQGFKAISRCSERPFLFRQQWKIIWIDPDP